MNDETEYPSVRIQKLLFSLRDYSRDRELRLFCCACVRRVLKLIGRAEASSAVEIAEAYVEGLATARELEEAESRVRAARYPGDSFEITKGIHAAAWCVERVVDAPFTARSVSSAAACARGGNATSEFDAQCFLVQDLFPEVIQVPWQTIPRPLDPEIESLARTLYDNRTPSGTFSDVEINRLRMSLQTTGYREQAVMTHLESPHPHVRGCWVVDLILGKRSLS